MEKLITRVFFVLLVMFSIVGTIGLLTQELNFEQILFTITMVGGSLMLSKTIIEEEKL
jgi:hypothetical protein